MVVVTVEYDTDADAKTLINVLKANKKSDRIKYNIHVVKVEESSSFVRTPTGSRIELSPAERERYEKLSNVKRRNAVRELIFFKAQGTFKGSKPAPWSPYQTAGPFYSNSILGEVYFSALAGEKAIHAKLSRDLNDAHNRTGEIGDWRITHSKQYHGFWSYTLEHFVYVNFPGRRGNSKTPKISRNIVISTVHRESE